MKLRTRTLTYIVSLLLAQGIAAEPAANQNALVEMKTSLGTVTLLLDAERAPLSVANFLQYVDDKHYDGTLFHRVIPGFMIQGGGYDAKMAERPTRAPIPNESENGLRNQRGTIAMARTNDPDSATSQFFINTVDNDSLDPSPRRAGYAVFGKVVQGMSVVQQIENVATGNVGAMADVPLEPVVIISMQRAQ